MAKSKEIFASKLSSLIYSKVISKTELHRKSGISRVVVDRYLSLETCPSLDALDQIADALNISANELIKDGSLSTSQSILLPPKVAEKLSKLSPAERKKLFRSFDFLIDAYLMPDEEEDLDK